MIIDTLTNLTCMYSTTTNCVDCDQDQLAELYTTAATSATTFWPSTSDTHIDINITTDYINSMSVEQLADFEQKLEGKSLEFEIPSKEDSEKILIKL